MTESDIDTYSKTPEEEQNGDQGNGPDRLTDSQGRSTSQTAVGDILAVLIVHRLRVGWAVLLTDLSDVFRLAEHLELLLLV